MVEHDGQYAVRWPITGNVHPAVDRADAEETVKIMREHDTKMAIEAARTEAANKLHWNVVTNEALKTNLMSFKDVEFKLDTNTAPFAFELVTLQQSSNVLEIAVMGEPIIMVRTNGQVWLAETNNMDAMSLQFWSSVGTRFTRLCPCSTNK